MTKIEVVRAAMMQAMKDKDKVRKDALSGLLSALKAQAIEKRADLTEEEENIIIQKEIKQLNETLETTPASYTDLITECKGKIAVLSEYAPQMMGAEEVSAIITKVLADLGIESPVPANKGVIMKALMPLVKGKADGKLVSELVEKAMNA